MRDAEWPDAELPEPGSRVLLAVCLAAVGAGWGLYAAQESWRHADVWQFVWVAAASVLGPVAIFLWRRPKISIPLLVVGSLISPPVVAALWVVLFLRGMHSPSKATIFAMVSSMATVSVQSLLYPTQVGLDFHIEVIARQMIFGVLMVAFSTAGGWLIGSHLRSHIRLRTLILQTARAETALGDTTRRDERNRLSRLIHDGLGSRAAVLNIYSQVLLSEGASESERAKATTLLAEESREVAQEIRHTIEHLAASRAHHSVGPLSDTVAVFSNAFAQMGSTLVTSIDSETVDLSDHLYDLLVVFVRESLTNALKYGSRGEVELTVRLNSAGQKIAVVRNCFGEQSQPAGSQSSAQGLRHLESEAHEVGARFSTDASSGIFTSRLDLPKSPGTASTGLHA